MQTSFVGRTEELAELDRLVESSELVVVTGPGGVGKSRLVRALVDGERGRSSAVIVGDLDGAPPGLEPDAVAAELGFGSVGEVGAALADPSTLLVLDDCDHVEPAVSDLLTAAAPDGWPARVVATSRRPLAIARGRLMVLGPLPLPASTTDAHESAAVRLFLERAAEAGAAWRPDDVLGDVVELCRRLDGLPLALVLAAARSRAFTPGELTALVDRRLDVLDVAGGRDVDARHSSLRAAIDVSLDLLEPDHRAALDRLAVLAGAFDLELAGAMASPDDELSVVGALAELVDRSLVTLDQRAGRSRYRVLNVVRRRAVDQLDDRGELEALRARSVDVAVAAASALIADGSAEWSPRIVERALDLHHHLVAAARWAIERDERPERVSTLLVAMFASVHLSRGREVLDLGERAARRWPGDDALAPDARAVLATAAAFVGDGDAAVEHGTATVDAVGASALAVVIARRALAVTTRQRGELADALEHAAAGRDVASSAGLTSFERDLAVSEAALADHLGEHDRAVELLDRVIEGATPGDDPIPQAGARLARASLSMRAGAWGAARRDLADAREIGASLDEPWWQGAVERTEAVLATCERGWAASRAAWRRAVTTPARRGNAGEMALTLHLAAAVALRFADDDVARALVGAMPAPAEIALLPTPFPAEAERVDRLDRPATRPALPTALRRALDALGPDDPAPPADTADTADATADAASAAGTTDTAASAAGTTDASDAADVAGTGTGDGRTARTGLLRRDGDSWTIAFAGRSASVRHLRGIVDLARLLADPEREVHAVELMGGAHVGGSPGDALDERARREYRERILELQAEIDEAGERADPLAAERAELELDAIVTQLGEAFGLGGRARPTGSSGERARSAVSYRIRRAIDRISTVHAEAGRHLEHAVRTGTWCAYRPEHPVTWTVTAGDRGTTPSR